jgi:hypothetical protein
MSAEAGAGSVRLTLGAAEIKQKIQATKKRKAEAANRLVPIARFLKPLPVNVPRDAQCIAKVELYDVTVDAIEAGCAVLATKPGTAVLEQQPPGGVRLWVRRSVKGFALVALGVGLRLMIL